MPPFLELVFKYPGNFCYFVNERNFQSKTTSCKYQYFWGQLKILKLAHSVYYICIICKHLQNQKPVMSRNHVRQNTLKWLQKIDAIFCVFLRFIIIHLCEALRTLKLLFGDVLRKKKNKVFTLFSPFFW